MKSRIITLAGVLLLLAVTGGNAITQTEETSQVWQGSVELTDAQKEQIARLQEQHREASAEAAAEIIKVRAEIQSLMVQTDTDLNALLRVMNRLSELENAQNIQRMRNAQACQDILTDEQKIQMRSGLRGGMSFFMQSRMGGGRAFQGRRGNFMMGRGQQGRFTQGRNMGNRGNWGYNRRFGNVYPNELGMRMRARIHTPGSALPPPSAPPPPPID